MHDWLSELKDSSLNFAKDCGISFKETFVNAAISKPTSETSPLAALHFRSLLLVGRTLELAITQIAIQAVLEGHDVFVLTDLVATQSEIDKPVLLDRLRFRGVDIVTSAQARIELKSYPVDLQIND